nr:Chain C, Nucleoprotein [Severe acute respiratory syndrome coronavirus 2]
RLNQLESKM